MYYVTVVSFLLGVVVVAVVVVAVAFIVAVDVVAVFVGLYADSIARTGLTCYQFSQIRLALGSASRWTNCVVPPGW